MKAEKEKNPNALDSIGTLLFTFRLQIYIFSFDCTKFLRKKMILKHFQGQKNTISEAEIAERRTMFRFL